MSPLSGRSIILGLVMGCVFGLAICPNIASSTEWKERLLTEAPHKWEALEQYYSKMEGSSRKIVATPMGGKPIPSMFEGTVVRDVRENGDWIVATIHRVGKRNGKPVDTIEVTSTNSRYAFRLGKPTSDAESFVLVNFEPVNAQARGKARGQIDFHLPFNPLGDRLSDVLKNPSFVITGVRGVRRDGKELVQMDYDIHVSNNDPQDPSPKNTIEIRHISLILDPERYWSVQECHFDFPNMNGDESLEYSQSVDGFPILRRSTYTQRGKNGLGDMLATQDFNKLVHRDIPENEFTLSAFGLPEMQVPGEQKPRTLWRWLVGIGIALGLFAVFLGVYVKKKRKAEQPV